MNTLTDTEKGHLDEHGALLLQNLIPPDTTEQLRETALALAATDRKTGKGYTYLADNTAQRVWNLLAKGEVFEQAIQQPKMLAAIEYLLGTDCTLSSFTVNILYPGAPDEGLHIDYPLSGLPTPRPSFPMVANTVWFLDDFTEENGATSCVPGSHRRLEALPVPGVHYADEVQVCGPRGSVLILNGATWHGASENRTDVPRVALLGFFCRAILKPQQAHLEMLPEEVVSRGTETFRRLIGLNSLPSQNR